MEEQLKTAALEYHRLPTPGKISVVPTKGLINQRDLALAYSPGVAYACKVIEANPKPVEDYRAGKQEAIKFLVGQAMRETRGRADPAVLTETLKSRLEANG